MQAPVSVQIRDNTIALGGDANLDGNVDQQDYLIWATNRFTATAGWRNADFNGDKMVDGRDLLIWNRNKFQSPDQVLVPEPAMVSWCAAWLLACWVRRRAAL